MAPVEAIDPGCESRGQSAEAVQFGRLVVPGVEP